MTTTLTAEDIVKRIRVSKIEFEGRAPYLLDSRYTGNGCWVQDPTLQVYRLSIRNRSRLVRPRLLPLLEFQEAGNSRVALGCSWRLALLCESRLLRRARFLLCPFHRE